MTDSDESASSGLPPSLGARYQRVRELGGGGFGRVFLVRDVRLDRLAALKCLRSHLDDPDSRARFAREARITSELRHPHIVPVYDFGISDEGVAHIVYEYVEGQDLGRIVTATRPSAATRARWGAQVADALLAAHQAGVIHRDVKPANILLKTPEHAVLCDFGVASREDGRTMLTGEGVILGTPEFMAPEVLLGDPHTPASDQFSLAATLFHVVYGRTAYPAGDLRVLLEVLDRGGHVEPPTREAGRGRWPALEAALMRGLAREPARRHADLGGFRDALEGAAREAEAASPGEAAAVTIRRPLAAPTAREAPTAVGPRPGGSAGRARGRRVWPALALVLAGTVLVAAWRTPPGAPQATPQAASPSPRAAPAPPSPRAAEVDRRLEQLRARHWAPGTRDYPEDGEARRRHVEQQREYLLAEAHVVEVEGLCKAFVAWVEADLAPRPPGAPLGAADRDRILGFLVDALSHLTRDFDGLGGDRSIETLMADEFQSGRVGWIPLLTAAQKLESAIQAVLGRIPPDLRARWLVLEVGWAVAAALHEVPLEEVFAALRGRFGGAMAEGDVELLLLALSRVASRRSLAQQLSCEDRVAAVADLVRSLEEVTREPGSEARAAVIYPYTTLIGELVVGCSPALVEVAGDLIPRLRRLEVVRPLLEGPEEQAIDRFLLRTRGVRFRERSHLPLLQAGLWWQRERSRALRRMAQDPERWQPPRLDRVPRRDPARDAELEAAADGLAASPAEAGATESWRRLLFALHDFVPRVALRLDRPPSPEDVRRLEAVEPRIGSFLERRAPGPAWERIRSDTEAFLWAVMPCFVQGSEYVLELCSLLAPAVEFPALSHLEGCAFYSTHLTDRELVGRCRRTWDRLTRSTMVAPEGPCLRLRLDLQAIAQRDRLTRSMLGLVEMVAGGDFFQRHFVLGLRAARLLASRCPGEIHAEEREAVEVLLERLRPESNTRLRTQVCAAGDLGREGLPRDMGPGEAFDLVDAIAEVCAADH